MDPELIEEEFSSFQHNETLLNYTRNVDNATDGSIYYFYKTPQYIIMGFLFFSIVILNSSVIVALLYSNARKSRMNFFIMQLAVADLFVGLIFIVVDIVHKYTIVWLAGNFLCKLLKYLQTVVLLASTYVLVALSIDRCDAITNPMNFSGSWNRARVLIISAWLISFIMSVPMFILYETKKVDGVMQCWIELGSPERWQLWLILWSLLVFILPALIIAACYAIIVLIIWTKNKAAVMSSPINLGRKKNISKCQLDNELESRRASSRGLIPRAKIKSVKMTFVIVFVFVLCWSPYFVFDFLQVYQLLPNNQTIIAMATLIQSLAPLNSVANPLICCMFSPHIFSTLRRMPPYRWFCCWRGQRQRGATLRSRSDSTANSDLLSSTHTKRSHSTAVTLISIRNGSASRRDGSSRRDGNRSQLFVMTSRGQSNVDKEFSKDVML